MRIPTIDGELYSEAGFRWDEADQKWRSLPGAEGKEKGLKVVGAAAYMEHPSTEILTVSYDLCDGRGVRRWRPGQAVPDDLARHITSGAPLEAHNVMFERLWINGIAAVRYGWPSLDPRQLRCSMATARVQALPGGLAELGRVLRLDVQKDKDGKRLIRKFCIPRSPTKTDPRRRIRPEDDPEDFERLCAYCDWDVAAEMAAADVMVPMSPAELEFWLIDQEINSRGLGIDRPAVRDCASVLNQTLERYTAECVAMTGFTPSQVAALTGWINGRLHGPTFTQPFAYGAEGELDDDVPF